MAILNTRLSTVYDTIKSYRLLSVRDNPSSHGDEKVEIDQLQHSLDWV